MSLTFPSACLLPFSPCFFSFCLLCCASSCSRSAPPCAFARLRVALVALPPAAPRSSSPPGVRLADARRTIVSSDCHSDNIYCHRDTKIPSSSDISWNTSDLSLELSRAKFKNFFPLSLGLERTTARFRAAQHGLTAELLAHLRPTYLNRLLLIKDLSIPFSTRFCSCKSATLS